MSFSIKVSGLSRVSNRLRIIPKFIKRGIEKGEKESGILLKNEIMESIRGNRAEPKSIDTGEFLNSIDIRQTKDGVSIFSNVPQSVWMEFGVQGKFAERRHFRNSLARNKTTILKNIINGVRSEL